MDALNLDVKEIWSRPEKAFAVELTEDNIREVGDWMGAKSIDAYKDLMTKLVKVTFTVERTKDEQSYFVRAVPGQWIVRHDSGVYSAWNKVALDINFALGYPSEENLPISHKD